MFTATSNKFTEHLQLHNVVSDELVTEGRVGYFDNDGFELTHLEREYYRASGVEMNVCLNHICDQRDWIVGSNDNFKIDHSLLLQRWEFAGDAKQQLLYNQPRVPQLIKFTRILPKWGIDFALDYFKDDVALEALHIEVDFRDYDYAQEVKANIETKILNTDWNDFVDSVIRKKSEWEYLKGFAQNDWKAVHWGLSKAEITEKTFVL